MHTSVKQMHALVKQMHTSKFGRMLNSKFVKCSVTPK